MEILFQEIHRISGNISEQSNSTIANILLFGDNKLDFETKKTSPMSTTELILSTERLSCPLLE